MTFKRCNPAVDLLIVFSTSIPLIFDIAQSNGVKILEIKYSRPTLDDVFLQLTGRKLREEEGSFTDFVRRAMFMRRRRMR